jgi:cytochrome c553
VKLGFLAPFLFLFGTGTAQSAANLETCLACHGASGVSGTPLTPSLGGMPSFYVVAQLFLFRGGRRASEVMEPMAKDLNDSDLTSLADAISKLPAPKPLAGDSDVSRLTSGRSLISKNNCASCHGADFSGDKNVPRIANQREDYLLKALRDYKGNKRVGYGNAAMPETVSSLNDAELADIAYYLARFRR